MASKRGWSTRHRAHPVLKSEIDALSQRLGYESSWQDGGEQESVVLGGNFALNRFDDGLHVHVTSGVEKADMTATFTVGPAVSIFILLEGYVAFQIGDEVWELGADDAVNVEAGLIWSRTKDTEIGRQTRKGRHVCKVGLTLEPGWFDQLGSALPPPLAAFRSRHLAQVQWCPSARAIRCAKDIVRPSETSPLQTRLAIQQNALQIIQEALNLFEGDVAEDENHEVSTRGPQIRDYLDETLDQELSLQEIGKEMGMSVTALQDRFRDFAGITVGEYRRQQRLVRAMLAIRDQGASVNDAAALAGYNSAANFATAFSRHFGYAPSQARG